MANISDCYGPVGIDNTTYSSWPEYAYYMYYSYYDEVFSASYYNFTDVYPVVLTSVAIFGNSTIIFTLLMKKNRIFSTASFFISLAAADIITTISGTFMFWISVRIPNRTWDFNMDCKLTTVFTHAAMYISSFSLATITAERAISVCFPHKVRVVCSPKIAKVTLAVLWILSFAFCTFIGFNVQVVVDQGYVQCVARSENLAYFFTYVYTWINLSFSFIFPFFVIFIGSLIIFNKLYLRSRSADAAKRTRLKTVSFTLIITNTVFMLANLPWTSFNIYILFRQLQDPCWDGDIETNHVLDGILLFLSESSHALNFFIYFLSGSQFRNDVKTLMKGLLVPLPFCRRKL